MAKPGPKNPDHVFERDGRRYTCWIKPSGVNPLGLAGPEHAEWHLDVDGHQYTLFDAVPDDLSYARMGNFEDRVHEWYESTIAGALLVGAAKH